MIRKCLLVLLLISGIKHGSYASETITNVTFNEVEKWIEKSKNFLNPDLFYNIALYYSSISNHGKAILYLKKAYLLSDKDKKIRELLESERKKIDVAIFSYEPSFIEKILSFPFDFAPINTLLIFGIVLYSMGGILIFLKLFRLEKVKFIVRFFDNNGFLIAGVIFFILGIAYISNSIFKYRTIFNKKEGVIIENTSLYDRAEKNSIEITKVAAGLECKIFSEENGYYLVSTISGKEGYIMTNFVERLW